MASILFRWNIQEMTKKVAIVMALITSATFWKVMMGKKVMTTEKVIKTEKAVATEQVMTREKVMNKEKVMNNEKVMNKEKVMTRQKVMLMEKVALLTIHWINPCKYLLLKNYESPLCLSFPEKELPYMN